MRIAAIAYEGRDRPAFLADGAFYVLPEEAGDLLDVIRGDAESLGKLARTRQGCREIPFDETLLRAPIRRFRRDILCAGWNYWDHFEEGRGRRDGQEVERPEHPTFFTKGPDTVVDPFAAIAFDEAVSAKWDYEVEVALIIGKDGRSIPEDRALEHVFGYCLANDVSQRDLQRRHGGQWLKGKSIDGTMPFGPYVTTGEDVDPQNLDVECLLNGRSLQRASTQLMAFPVAQLISELSFGMTLRAGDVLLTGTPAGVGNARTPPLFLKEGDELISRSEQLGEMRNILVAADLHSPRL